METIWLWIQRNLIRHIIPPKSIEIIDIIQIIIIAYIVYSLILWAKSTRAYTLLKGIVLIILFVVIAIAFRMQAILWIIQNLSIVAITALIIIFQPELRKALEKVGHTNPITSLFAINKFGTRSNERFSDAMITQILRAVVDMSESKTGALIIIEEEVRMDDVAETGIALDAVVSTQLLINIFEHNTPLHDGAAIIRDGRIIAATCYLPLSENMSLSKQLGTRHRAGIGVTEMCDCLAIMVSEENGKISYAYEGVIHTGLSASELREVLHEHQKIVPSRFKRKDRVKVETKSVK